ncbi:MAG: OmpA family protein [Gammaproteobacteria bacterium]|nr:MAG: OmpA family protein [Gammaproteobacteria bacterium]
MVKLMKKLAAAIGVSLLTLSASVFAQEGLYLGPSLGYYYLDSDRVVSGHDEAGVAGFNVGYRFFNDWALEAGYGKDIAGDDLDVAQINAYFWLGEDNGGWRPYVVAGFSYYDRDGENNLWSDEEYTHQAQIGFGLSKMISDQWEFRGDARIAHKLREGNEGINDGSLNFALNYYFNKPAAPVVEAPVEPREPEMPAPEPETRTITVRLNVEFEFDKAIVRAIYGDELHAVANAMKVHDDITLVLEGHTDARGSDDYNQGLSERRAAAVKAKIVEDYGIDPSRITTEGYGESRPIADNATDEGRARNRRVVGEMTYTEVVE